MKILPLDMCASIDERNKSVVSTLKQNSKFCFSPKQKQLSITEQTTFFYRFDAQFKFSKLKRKHFNKLKQSKAKKGNFRKTLQCKMSSIRAWRCLLDAINRYLNFIQSMELLKIFFVYFYCL